MSQEDPIQQPFFKKTYAIVLALLGWASLILQFYLLLKNKTSDISLWSRFFNFFSYFTILTNILVALSLTLTVLGLKNRIGRFFRNDSVQSALTVYILIVGVVYYLLLRNIWKPQGLQFLADVTLHYAVPVLYLVYWLIFIPKGKLRLRYAISWMAYPALYFIYSLIRGAVTHWYPYPFIDAQTSGYNTVFLNAAVLLVAFIAAVLIFIGVDRLLAGKAVKR
ncbi:MAG: Pr6Pr family membrane protein [Bacteroidetes bacterium]|nr:Pr6Pr family membrane protein [Bacteroidota bacterium]MBS1607542.1 Pr6Pr family membrane protein [Bacteroidota bacterium]